MQRHSCFFAQNTRLLFGMVERSLAIPPCPPCVSPFAASGRAAACRSLSYKNAPENEELAGFSLLERKTLSYGKNFSGDEVRDLFMMTPYAYRTAPHERKRLDEIAELFVGMRFIILVYRKL